MMIYYREVVITENEKEIIRNLKDNNKLKSLGHALYEDVWEELYEE